MMSQRCLFQNRNINNSCESPVLQEIGPRGVMPSNQPRVLPIPVGNKKIGEPPDYCVQDGVIPQHSRGCCPYLLAIILMIVNTAHCRRLVREGGSCPLPSLVRIPKLNTIPIITMIANPRTADDGFLERPSRKSCQPQKHLRFQDSGTIVVMDTAVDEIIHSWYV